MILPTLKPLYHAALNFGAAYLLTLLNTGCKLLETSDIKNPEEVILSLAGTTLHNAKKFGIKNSFTGPIERGDSIIIEEELEIIKKMCPENYEIYKKLVEYLRVVGERFGKSTAAFNRVRYSYQRVFQRTGFQLLL